ncbi:MAG: hypothetical protein QM768_20345 [Agriterribacter sp.]
MGLKNSKLYKDITDHPGRWAFIVLLSLFLASMLLLIVLGISSNLDEKSFGREIGKTLLQIIAISVIGVAVSWLLKEHQNKKEDASQIEERERKLSENRNQFMKNILHELNEIYRGTKSARRMLRARSFKVSYQTALEDNSAIIDTQIYDFYLEKINSYQLELETILSEIDTDTKLFKNHEEIKTSINKMQEYLHNLIEEYEKNRFKANSDTTFLTMGSLGRIRELIDHAKDNKGKDGLLKTTFIQHYKDAVKLIRQELLFGNDDKGDK